MDQPDIRHLRGWSWNQQIGSMTLSDRAEDQRAANRLNQLLRRWRGWTPPYRKGNNRRQGSKRR